MKRGARGARVLFFFFLLLILLAMFFWSGLKISGNAVASLNNSSTVDYNLGDSVRINLSVNNVTNLSGIQVNVSYNPSVLTYTGAEEGSFLNENGIVVTYFNSSEIETSSGHVNYIIIFREGEDYGATGSGTLASLYFNASGSGTTSVGISDSLFSDNNGNPLSITIQNTSVKVSGTQSSDSTAPTVVLNSPADHYNTTSQTISFNATATDETALANVTLYGNWTGSWTANQTNSSPKNGAYTRFTISHIPEGRSIWNIYACDTSDNCAYGSLTRTLTIDRTGPTITINNPVSGSTLSDSMVLINISFTDLSAMDTCYYNITNSSTVVPNTLISCGQGSSDYQNLSDGNYTISSFANDTLGNSRSANQVFYVNTSSSSGNETGNETGGNTGGSSGGGGGGGGSSGGTGGTTSNATVTVNKTESLDINPQAPAIFKNFSKDSGIKQIRIYVRNPVKNITIDISKYIVKPSEIEKEKSGKVYEYLHITPENLGSELKNATIQFYVNKSWVDNNTAGPEDLSMFRYNNSSKDWEDLNSSYIDLEIGNYYYETFLENFSYFAIAQESSSAASGTGILSSVNSLASGNARIIIAVLIGIIILAILVVLVILVVRAVKKTDPSVRDHWYGGSS